jgi:rhodanese-related sulfurtransferase
MLVSWFSVGQGTLFGQESAQPSEPTYCGIYAMYRACGILGRDVPMSNLVNPKYIGTRQGSSIAELKEAAADSGISCKVLSRMNCQMLRAVQTPVILHVRGRFDSEYNHWILFAGVENDFAKIYDGVAPSVLVDFREIAAKWDGIGLVLSSTTDVDGQQLLFLYIESLAPFLYVTLVLIVGYCVAQRCDRILCLRAEGSSIVIKSALQCLGVLCVAGLSGAAYLNLNPQGYLSHEPAIHVIQHSRIISFLPKMKSSDVERMQRASSALFVDARREADFARGHLKNALNIPPDTSTRRCGQLMASIPKEQLIVIYCQSSGCPYTKYVAKTIWANGYRNLAIFKGGWHEWNEYTRKSDG